MRPSSNLRRVASANTLTLEQRRQELELRKLEEDIRLQQLENEKLELDLIERRRRIQESE